MKSNFLTTVLGWVLTAVLVLTVIFLVQYYFRTKEYRALAGQVQAQGMAYQKQQALLNMLGNDLNQYSKANPAIIPLLKSLTQRTNPPAPDIAIPGAK